MSGIRAKLSYANVMATIAVFLALGGGAYAAIDLVGRNDIKSKHIAPGHVRTSDLGNGAVTPSKLAPGNALGFLGADWGGLTTTPNTSSGRAPEGVDDGTTGGHNYLAPVTMVVRDFRVVLTSAPGAGASRVLGLTVSAPPFGSGIGHSCEISGTDTDCTVPPFTVPAGNALSGFERVPVGSNAPAPARAYIGYRVVTP